MDGFDNAVGCGGEDLVGAWVGDGLSVGGEGCAAGEDGFVGGDDGVFFVPVVGVGFVGVWKVLVQLAVITEGEHLHS